MEVTGTEKKVCDLIAKRQALGLAKYGVTVENNPLSLRQWKVHLLEELLDAAIYTMREIEELDRLQRKENEKQANSIQRGNGARHSEWQ